MAVVPAGGSTGPPPPVMALNVLVNCQVLCGGAALALVVAAEGPEGEFLDALARGEGFEFLGVLDGEDLGGGVVDADHRAVASMAHSWAEDLSVQIWPSWVCSPFAALIAAWPMSMAGAVVHGHDVDQVDVQVVALGVLQERDAVGLQAAGG